MRLRTETTWDGGPARVGEIAQLSLRHEGDALLIEVDAPFHGDPPPPGPPGPTDRLWEHEVVELFVVGPGPVEHAPYLEIELGPHGHHLALQLLGRRRPVRTLLPLVFGATRGLGRWLGRARVPREWLPPEPHRVNAFAIHGQGARRRYLAAFPVPGPEPDFHRLQHFPVRRLVTGASSSG